MALIEGQIINNQANTASSAGAAGPASESKGTAPGPAAAAAAPNEELGIGLLDAEVDDLFGDQDLALQFLDNDLFKAATSE